MIYLASPYTHDAAHIRASRYSQALTYVVSAMNSGAVIFSPIVYGHNICKAGYSDFTASGWQSFNDIQLNAASEVRVLMLDGWHTSVGVQAEIQQARQLLKPVSFVTPLVRKDKEYIA